MNRKFGVCAILGLLLIFSTGTANAEFGVIDVVPATTMLLPYFEVDLRNPDGFTTLFSVNNASSTAAIAEISLWSDSSVKIIGFDVRIEAYDVQTFDLRPILAGEEEHWIVPNDGILRGYAVIRTRENVLWGDYFHVNASLNFAQGETLVHIETEDGESESLPTSFVTRYAVGPDWNTRLSVWRSPGSASRANLIACDEEENCVTFDIELALGAQALDIPAVPFTSGLLYLNLGQPAWVTTVLEQKNRYSVAFDAIPVETPAE